MLQDENYVQKRLAFEQHFPSQHLIGMVRFMEITTNKVSPINCEIIDGQLEQLWEQHKLRLLGQAVPMPDAQRQMTDGIIEDSRKLEINNDEVSFEIINFRKSMIGFEEEKTMEISKSIIQSDLSIKPQLFYDQDDFTLCMKPSKKSEKKTIKRSNSNSKSSKSNQTLFSFFESWTFMT